MRENGLRVIFIYVFRKIIFALKEIEKPCIKPLLIWFEEMMFCPCF
jgi:hypothetical protein